MWGDGHSVGSFQHRSDKQGRAWVVRLVSATGPRCGIGYRTFVLAHFVGWKRGL